MRFPVKKIAVICILAFSFSQSIFADDKNSEYVGRGMMGRGYYGRGMMGAGMMDGCPYATSENVKMNVTETADGVTIHYSAKDKKDITRIQKMAKMSKLSQEINEEEVQKK